MTEEAKSLHAVSLKLPPYWPNDPAVWFLQVEAQFKTRGITSQDTMYTYIISSLQPEVIQEVRDLLMKPPTEKPYDTIKEELIRRTSESEQKRLHQLLIAEELGDRRPTQLLRRMQQLLGEKKLEDSFLRRLLLQRLPSNVQLILASMSEGVDIQQLAEIADKIMEISPAPVSPVVVAETTVKTPTLAPLEAAPVVSETQLLREMVEKLSQQVSTLSDRIDQRTSRGREDKRRNRSSSPSRSNSPAPGESNFKPWRTTHAPNTPCWFHWKYGNKAKRCIDPCSFSPKDKSQGNSNANT